MQPLAPTWSSLPPIEHEAVLTPLPFSDSQYGLAPGAAQRRAVFLDKDGTLIEDVPFNVDPALLRFTPGAVEALQRLDAAGFALIVVTNQSGIALGRFTRAQLVVLQQALEARVLRETGVALTGFYVCPHAPARVANHAPTQAPIQAPCLCRKPAPGLLRQAARRHDIDLARSWMVGDILDDIEAGRRAGTRTVLLDVGHETIWRTTPLRTPHHLCADLLAAAHVITQAADAPPAEGKGIAATDGHIGC